MNGWYEKTETGGEADEEDVLPRLEVGLEGFDVLLLGQQRGRGRLAGAHGRVEVRDDVSAAEVRDLVAAVQGIGHVDDL